MGIIRLTLITVFLLWLGLKYFGRDEGLSGILIGRVAEPAPAGLVTAPEPEPEAAPDEQTAEIAPMADLPPQAVAPDPFDAALAEALADELASAASPVAAPAPAPDPVAEPEPVALLEPAAQPTPETTVQPETTVPQLYVTGSTVNMRAGPATSYDVIAALTLGAAVTDLGNAGDGWRIIQIDSGEIGYMSGDFLSPEAP